MARPTYERQADRERQAEAIAVIERAWGCSAAPTKAFYPFDYALKRRSIVAWAEVKCRTNEHSRYPTYMLSLHKWKDGLHYESTTGLPFLIVVSFTDGVFYHQPSKGSPSFDIGGRQDRGDAADMEPCVFIPIQQFKRISE